MALKKIWVKYVKREVFERRYPLSQRPLKTYMKQADYVGTSILEIHKI